MSIRYNLEKLSSTLGWWFLLLPLYPPVSTPRVAAPAAKPETDYTNNATYKKMCVVFCLSVFYLNYI